ncbi:MAG: transglycosylase domain-containing protein [Treponema sp.]|jgi:penicillin-binding protein 1C|nr:transglycosylase domain-containing protein [Treponema sp.]
MRKAQRTAGSLFRLLGGAAALVLASFLILRFSPYPELEAFLSRPYSVRYYDRNGSLAQISPLAGGLRREYRPLAEIPPELRAVFVYAEDRRFYRHPGLDLLAAGRALIQNISGRRRVSGASTITMQLARLIDRESGSRAAPLLRKAGEALNALRLETRLGKDDILELYLNSLPFGFQCEGLGSAARTFFSAEITALSPAQIFCLAVIPRRPGTYNPLEFPETCIAAARELQGRFSSGKKSAARWPLLAAIAPQDWEFAAASARRFAYPFEFPHLIRLAQRAGKTPEPGKGGPAAPRPPAEIRLSLDLSLQRYLEGLISGNVARYYGSRLTNGAALVMDNRTGEILAWVGSADYDNLEAAGQIDGVLALNQPGSSMKPFLYAMALESGFKPTDVLADVPMNFGESELYIPQNFNNRFNGPMLFRSALASSLNIPAVSLLYRLGVRNYTGLLLDLGFASLERSAEDAGLGLALGNAPVSLAELVRAFSVFPNDGLLIPLSWEARDPEKPLAGGGAPRRIYQADTARLICSFLSDREARTLAFGNSRNFRASFPIVFKTGTANQYQSIVALGATPRYTAAVWMGNFTGETVIGKTGSSVPAAIVRDALVYLQNRLASPASAPGFPEPGGWVLRRVCALSGMEPTEACLSVVSEYTTRGTGLEPCSWHRDSTVVYPAEYQAWFAALPRQGRIDYGSRPLEIISPRDGFVFLRSPGIGRDEIPVEVIGGDEDTLLADYRGARFTVNRPFLFYLPSEPGRHILSVRNGGEAAEVAFTVE